MYYLIKEVCVCVRMRTWACKHTRFSLSIVWVPGTELRKSGIIEVLLSSEPSYLAPSYHVFDKGSGPSSVSDIQIMS